jgi:hypothetical protein
MAAPASRGGPEKVTTGRLRATGPTSTVPGEGGVREDPLHRKTFDRSAAAYTGPAVDKYGGGSSDEKV